MRLHRSALLASVAPLVLAFVLASCGGGGETPTTPTNNNGTGNPPGGGTGNPPGGGGGPPSSADVGVNDTGFSPTTVVLAKNGTVTWTWAGGTYGGSPHNVTFTADGDSSNDKTEGTFSKTFPNTGVFAYKCTNHPAQMTGTVDVR